MRLFLPTATAALALSLAAPAQAQFGFTINGKTSADRDREKVVKLNDEMNRARKLLPERFGEDPEKEAKACVDAEAPLPKIRKDLPKYDADKRAFEQANQNLASLDVDIAQCKIAAATGAAVKKVADQHDQGKSAPDADIQAMKDATAKFTKDAPKSWTKLAKFFADRSEKFSAENATVAQRFGQEQEAKAKREADKKAEADRKALEEKTHEAGRVANEALSDLQSAVSSNTEVTEAQLTALEQAAAGVKAIYPEAATFYTQELGFFRALAMWAKPDPEAQKTIAEFFGAELAGSGRTTGKKLKVEVNAKADTCYLLVGSFANYSGTEEVKEFFWQMAGAGTGPQEFSLRRAGDKWNAFKGQGFCMTHPAKVTANADLVFAGSKNGLRYAVLAWEKAKFPMQIAAHIGLNWPDRCDTESWYELWTKPVPGTFTYVNGEPALTTYVDDVGGNTYLNFVRVNGADSHTYKKDATTEPPKNVVVKSQFQFKGCHNEPGPGRPLVPMAKAIADCHLRIDKKYEAQWTKIEAVRKTARDQGGVVPANEARAAELEEKQRADREKTCGPLEEKAQKKVEETYTKLVDALVDARYKDALPRAEYTAAEELAPYRKW